MDSNVSSNQPCFYIFTFYYIYYGILCKKYLCSVSKLNCPSFWSTSRPHLTLICSWSPKSFHVQLWKIVFVMCFLNEYYLILENHVILLYCELCYGLATHGASPTPFLQGTIKLIVWQMVTYQLNKVLNIFIWLL